MSRGSATSSDAPEAELARSVLPRRDQLQDHVEEVLSRGGWYKADVLLVRIDGRALVVKDFARKGPVVRRLLAPWLNAREASAYARLRDLDAVPRCLGAVDALALVIEYRPGRLMSRRLVGELPPTFLPRLRRSVEAMHDRGVVHLDLRHRSNVLASEAGDPVLIDFTSALSLRPGSLLHRLLSRIDRLALEKWERKLGPASVELQARPSASSSASARAESGTTSAGSQGASRPT